MYNNLIVKLPIYLLTLLIITRLPFQQEIAAEASGTATPVKVAVASFSQLPNLNDFIRDDNLNGPTFPFLNAQGAVMTTSTSQTSSLFTKTQMAKANPTSPGFSTYFVMDIYKTNSEVPADGYVFTLANNTSTLGSTGGGLGYRNVPNSVGIIFDYFQNNASEIVASTDVFTNGSMESRTGSGYDSSFLDEWRARSVNQKVRSMHTWIEYNASTSTIEIRVSPDNANRPNIATRIQNNLTLNQISEFYYAGFSAATGGSSMSVVLNQWYFASEFIGGGINLNTRSYIVDNTPPTQPIISTSFNNNQYELTVSGGTDDNGISGYQIKKPGGNFLTYQTPVIMDVIGQYEARTIDTVGNFSTTTSKIGLWQIQFFGSSDLLKTMKVLSTDVYQIQELLSDNTFRYEQWFLNNQLVEEIAYPSQSIQLVGLGVRYVFPLNYTLNGGTPLSPLPLTYTMGTTWEDPQLELEGHTFEGWFTDQGLTLPFDISAIDETRSSLSLFAKFTPIQLSIELMDQLTNEPWVILDSYFGALVQTRIENQIPTRIGYTFQKWTLDESGQFTMTAETVLVSSLRLYAQWSINTYTIDFNANGGTSFLPSDYIFEATLDLPQPTKEGHSFQAWYNDEALSSIFLDSIMPASDITLYAKWVVNQYSITFETQGGSTIPNLVLDFGSVINVPTAPIKIGYTFDGWFNDALSNEEVVVPSTMPATHLTWFAKWIINTHTVTFLNHTNEIIQTFSLDYGLNIENTPAIVRPGYRFLGWALNGERVDFSTFTMPDEAVLFSPVFEGLTVQLKLITMDATLTIEATSGEAIGALPILPMNVGYSFIGWSLAPLDHDQLINENYVVPNVETLMLFPIWSESNPPIQLTKLSESTHVFAFDYASWIAISGLIIILGAYIVKAIKEESIHA